MIFLVEEDNCLENINIWKHECAPTLLWEPKISSINISLYKLGPVVMLKVTVHSAD